MKASVIQFLQDHRIPYSLTEHPAVYTMEQMEALGLQKLGCIPKNLFIRDGKGRQHFILTVCGDTAVDFKTLGEKLGIRKPSLASAERLQRYLGITAGCVSPLGVINDRDHSVTVVFEERLRAQSRIGVHPNVHNATVWLSFPQLLEAVEAAGNPVRILEL